MRKLASGQPASHALSRSYVTCGERAAIGVVDLLAVAAGGSPARHRAVEMLHAEPATAASEAPQRPEDDR